MQKVLDRLKEFLAHEEQAPAHAVKQVVETDSHGRKTRYFIMSDGYVEAYPWTGEPFCMTRRTWDVMMSNGSVLFN